MVFEAVVFPSQHLAQLFSSQKSHGSLHPTSPRGDDDFYVGTRAGETIAILKNPSSWREIFPDCENSDFEVRSATSYILKKPGKLVRVVDCKDIGHGVQLSVTIMTRRFCSCSFTMTLTAKDRMCSGSFLRVQIENFKSTSPTPGLNRSHRRWFEELKLNLVDLLKKDEDNFPVVFDENP